MNILTGTIVNYDANRGFGFIKPDIRGKNVFFHVKNGARIDEDDKGEIELCQCRWSSCVEGIGQRVAYVERNGDKGPFAETWVPECAFLKAQKILSERPSPEKPFYRIYNQRENPFGLGDKVVWNGYDLEGYLTQNSAMARLLQNKTTGILVLERLRVDGQWLQ